MTVGRGRNHMKKLVVGLVVAAALVSADRVLAAQDAFGQAVVNTSARVGAKQGTVCVPKDTPVAIPSSAYKNRKGFALYNKGSYDIEISFDPTHAPSNSGSSGWPVRASDSASFDVSELGTTTTVYAVSHTADQVSPKCTEVLELR